MTFFLSISTFFISCRKKSLVNADRRNWLEKHLLAEKRLFEHVWTFFLRTLKTDTYFYKERNLTAGLLLQIANSKSELFTRKSPDMANSGFNIIFIGNENVGVKWCSKMNWKCVNKPYLLLGSQRERGVKICQRESIFTSELWLLSQNFPINNDWGNHYLLVNYDMESLFREAKILRDTGVISFFATRKCQKIRKIDENSWYSKTQCWYFFFYFVFYVVTNFLFTNLQIVL